MSGKNAKDIRNQIRNVALEILPQVISNEAFAKLQTEMHSRLDQVTAEIRQALTSMAERQKDVQNYLMREISAGQSARPASAPTPEQADESK